MYSSSVCPKLTSCVNGTRRTGELGTFRLPTRETVHMTPVPSLTSFLGVGLYVLMYSIVVYKCIYNNYNACMKTDMTVNILFVRTKRDIYFKYKKSPPPP